MERVLELVLGATLIVATLSFDPATPMASGPDFWREWNQALWLIVAFEVVTLYVASTFFLSVLARAPHTRLQVGAAVVLFLLHCGALALATGGWDFIAMLALPGSVSVAMAALAGSILLKFIDKSRSAPARYPELDT